MILKDWFGIAGGILAPFTKDNKLDEALIRKQIDYQADNGIHSIDMNFHSGEVGHLSYEERQLLAKIGVDQAKRKGVPTIVHTGYSSTDLTVKLAKYYESIGVDCVCVCTPYRDSVWTATDEAIAGHFRAVSEAINTAMFIYNNPHRTGVSISPALVGKLVRELDNLVGMKEASNNVIVMSEMCRATKGTNFAVFGGLEYLLPLYVLGGKGAMSGTCKFAPKKAVELYDLVIKGEYGKARELQQKLLYVWATLSRLGSGSSMKVAMEIMGKPIGPPRRPAIPIDDAKRQELKKVLEETGILKECYGW